MVVRRESVSLGSLIASAPLSPDGWRPALKAIRSELGCAIAMLTTVDQVSNRVTSYTDGGNPEAVDLYRERCGDAADVDPRACYAMSAPEMRVWTEWNLPIPQRAAARDLYETVFKPLDADFARAVVISRHDTATSCLSTAEPAATADHCDRTNDALIEIAKVVRRALALERSLQAEGLGRVADVTQTLSAPAALLNIFGRVLHVTPRASQVLAERSEIGIVGQRLVGRCPEIAERLRRAIVLATREMNPEADIVQTGQGLTLKLVPLPRSHRISLGEHAAAMVVFSYTTVADPLQALANRYGLTNAEREIAGLIAEGLSTDEIAERRSAARETVRSQVRAIYFKTASCSRAEFLAKFYQRAAS